MITDVVGFENARGPVTVSTETTFAFCDTVCLSSVHAISSRATALVATLMLALLSSGVLCEKRIADQRLRRLVRVKAYAHLDRRRADGAGPLASEDGADAIRWRRATARAAASSSSAAGKLSHRILAHHVAARPKCHKGMGAVRAAVAINRTNPRTLSFSAPASQLLRCRRNRVITSRIWLQYDAKDVTQSLNVAKRFFERRKVGHALCKLAMACQPLDDGLALVELAKGACYHLAW